MSDHKTESMRWAGLEPDGLGDWETDARIIVAWVKANGGEARYYEHSPYSNGPHIAIRTRDGWAYCLPGQRVVMGEWFDPLDRSPAPLLDFKIVREFKVED